LTASVDSTLIIGLPGRATNNIGRAIATAFVAEGVHVVVSGGSEPRERTLVPALETVTG
jgi:NAD(P)-dependent dehydrogenase (short-subunit alcohol dehydrogenase family)